MEKDYGSVGRRLFCHLVVLSELKLTGDQTILYPEIFTVFIQGRLGGKMEV
jgi:hypothetical protein